MASVSILDFDKIPNIHSRIYDTEIITLEDARVFEGNEHSLMVIMLSGSATYKSSLTEKSTGKHTFSSNHILIIPKSENLEIKPTTQQCQFFYIVFDLYAIKSSLTETLNSTDTLFNLDKLHLLNQNISISSVESHHPLFSVDIHSLINHYKANPTSLSALSYPLNTVIHTILQLQFSTSVSVLKRVNAVAITSRTPNFATPLEFSISNITVWSDKKAKPNVAEKIVSFFCSRTYTEAPAEKKSYTCVFNKSEPESHCDFNMFYGERFKLWLFPDSTIPSLEEHKINGVIRFRFKSNQSGKFNLILYHTPSYKSINYVFEITEPNRWTDFEIMLSKNTSLNILPPYVEKAVQFIQENYSEKITIQDIANHVRIHPSYLSSIFRKGLNKSVNNYINFYRINIAKQLLNNNEISITDIALQTGFYDAQHFLKTFKKNTGLTPSEFRNISYSEEKNEKN